MKNLAFLSRRKAPPGPNPQVPYTVFNFRAESVRSQSRSRRLTQATAALAVAALVVTGLVGVNARRDASTARADAEDAFAERFLAEQDLRNLTGGADDLPSHIAGRRTQLGVALSSDTDMGALVASVLATAPAGVVVSSVSLSGAVTDATAAGEPVVPDVDTPGELPPAPPEVPRTVRISATAPDFDAPIVWRNTLTGLGYLTELVVDPSSGSGGGVTLEISATVAGGELQSRRQAVAGDIGSLSGAAPAPQTGGS